VTTLWFSPGPPVSSTNKTDSHDIAEILLKVVFKSIKQTNKQTIKEKRELVLAVGLVTLFFSVVLCLVFSLGWA
jgi:hypothetical protein